MIHAESLIDESTMLEARNWHWRACGLAKWALPAFGILQIALAIILLLIGYSKPFLPTALIILGIWFLIRKSVLGLRFRAAVRKLPMYQKQVLWTLSDERLRMDVDGNTSDSDLGSFFLTRITPQGILFYPQKNVYYWLPKTAFETNKDFCAAVDLLKAKTRWKEIG